MTTPLATIADALIEFIMSLLRDPAAAAELEDDPEGVLARNGLGSACADDVRAVAPVIVDHPSVVAKPATAAIVVPHSGPPSVLREIQSITNNMMIDSRSTIIDQSVNQNIWAEGDVNQIFDQETVVASGDGAVAAGNDATMDNSDNTTTVGDVSIGNTDVTNDTTGSYNDSSTNTDVDVAADVADSFNDGSADVSVTADVATPADPAAAGDPVTAVVDAPEPAAVVDEAADDAFTTDPVLDDSAPVEFIDDEQL